MMCPTTLVALTMAIGLTPRIGVPTSHVFLAPKITLTSLWTSHAPRLSLLVLSKSDLGTLKLSARPHEAHKRRTYGNVAPHVVRSFVLDDSGGLAKRRGVFFCSAEIERGAS